MTKWLLFTCLKDGNMRALSLTISEVCSDGINLESINTVLLPFANMWL